MCNATDKAALRGKYKAVRASLKTAERDGQIASSALALAGGYADVFVYLSVRSEVDTHALIGALRARGKAVYVPRVEGDKLLSVPLREPLVRGAFGILQPPCGREHTCGLAFVPLLSADERGVRLGYGGGFYDRYFAAHPEVLRVGLAYEGQVCGVLPHDARDVPLDALITECGIRRFPRNA